MTIIATPAIVLKQRGEVLGAPIDDPGGPATTQCAIYLLRHGKRKLPVTPVVIARAPAVARRS